jgi:hypothetical protein
MPEERRNGPFVVAIHGQPASEGMPEVVPSDIGQPRGLNGRTEDPRGDVALIYRASGILSMC